MIGSAALSTDGRFRWWLRRAWDDASWRGGHERVTWIMLNPSTADSDVDDPTIRRCVGFSKDWGFGALTVVNLFAFRTAFPSELRAAGYPVGHDNDLTILNAAFESSLVVAAWGAWAASDVTIRARARHVFDLVTCPPNEIRLECLGRTSGGAPRHPLMVRKNQPREELYACCT